MYFGNFLVWLLCTGIEDGASSRYRNMVILARGEALPSLATRAFRNPEVVSPLWRVPLTRTLVGFFSCRRADMQWLRPVSAQCMMRLNLP